MSNAYKMLNCPFCGSIDVKNVTDDGIHFTQCCKCEATGPTGFKRGDEDAPDWNTRYQPADQQGEPVAWANESDLRPSHVFMVTSNKPCTRYADGGKAIALYRHAQPAAAKVDEQAEFDKAWPNISLGGVENGWRGVALAAWKARAKLNTPQ